MLLNRLPERNGLFSANFSTALDCNGVPPDLIEKVVRPKQKQLFCQKICSLDAFSSICNVSLEDEEPATRGNPTSSFFFFSRVDLKLIAFPFSSSPPFPIPSICKFRRSLLFFVVLSSSIHNKRRREVDQASARDFATSKRGKGG